MSISLTIRVKKYWTALILLFVRAKWLRWSGDLAAVNLHWSACCRDYTITTPVIFCWMVCRYGITHSRIYAGNLRWCHKVFHCFTILLPTILLTDALTV